MGISAVRATGRGAESHMWMQLKADVAGVPVKTIRIREAGYLGAAFLAELGTGIYCEPDDTSRLALVDRTDYPDPGTEEQYDAAYRTDC